MTDNRAIIFADDFLFAVFEQTTRTEIEYDLLYEISRKLEERLKNNSFEVFNYVNSITIEELINSEPNMFSQTCDKICLHGKEEKRGVNYMRNITGFLKAVIRDLTVYNKGE